ncbi:hypothetical protein BSKO_13836 [Bryopsis sp. KO-2023]|nr:hypothetical protein BSKO_08124 [Bryopsis sp. KO-2023]GMH45873.1 hypothetical protein BSKO_13836 [Bryopsis sp. KO-2023]
MRQVEVMRLTRISCKGNSRKEIAAAGGGVQETEPCRSNIPSHLNGNTSSPIYWVNLFFSSSQNRYINRVHPLNQYPSNCCTVQSCEFAKNPKHQ